MFDFVSEVMHDDPLKLCIVQAKEEEEHDLEIVKQIAYLEANEIIVQRKKFEKIDSTKEKWIKTLLPLKIYPL